MRLFANFTTIVKILQQWFNINGKNAFTFGNAWIEVKPTLVELQSPSSYGKVPFAMSGPPNSTNTGDIHKKTYKIIILEIMPEIPDHDGNRTVAHSAWSEQRISLEV